MRRVFLALPLLLAAHIAHAAPAQPVVLLCGSPPSPCTSLNPLPTTATISGSVTVNSTLTAIAALPTLAPGAQTPRGSLAGAAYVQPVFSSASGGGTQVDATHGLPVALLAGTAIAGKFGIDQTTPGTTNGVQINAALPAGTAILGSVGIDQTTAVTTNGVVIAPTAAAAAGLATVASTAVESSHVLKSGAGNLYTLTTVIGGTSGYLMLFNATSAPGDGAVTPAYCFPILSNGTLGGTTLGWMPGPPLKFSTGITAVFSSTGCYTKTASATANFFGQVN